MPRHSLVKVKTPMNYNNTGKAFYVEVGEHIDTTGDDAWLYEDQQLPPDGLMWQQRGGFTDSFPEVEARSTLLSKTFKNVRIMSREIEVIAHVES